MKVEFKDFVVKIKAQYKTEKGNRTEKFLYHLLGVYADAKKTAIREGKFVIAQAYSKEIEGIRNAIRQAEAAREEAEEKERGVGFKIGDKVIIPEDKRKDLRARSWFTAFEKQFPKKKVYEISGKFGASYKLKGDKWGFYFDVDWLKAHEESEELVGKKIWVENKAEYKAVINKLDKMGFCWMEGEKAKEWRPNERFPYYITIREGKHLVWGWDASPENVIPAEEFISKRLGAESK